MNLIRCFNGKFTFLESVNDATLLKQM